MKTTSELARETALKVRGLEVLSNIEFIIQSVLDAQAAQYWEALKVATDALGRTARKHHHDYHLITCGWSASFAECTSPICVDARDALARTTKLTPKP